MRDERFTQFELRPFTGALGAEIIGVDLRTTAEDTFAEVLRALHEYHVLAVRDQDLVPATLQQVARRFGPFSGNPVHTPMDGFDDIVRFVRERDDTGKVIGEDWHMDLAWLAKPPGVTMLYGEEVPPVGGDTCFTSLEKAYQSLSREPSFSTRELSLRTA
jgi:taurine dioxygenase